jgi:hypothetical protein
MAASVDSTECVLIMGSEAVSGEVVGCIAWLGLLVVIVENHDTTSL